MAAHRAPNASISSVTFKKTPPTQQHPKTDGNTTREQRPEQQIQHERVQAPPDQEQQGACPREKKQCAVRRLVCWLVVGCRLSFTRCLVLIVVGTPVSCLSKFDCPKFTRPATNSVTVCLSPLRNDAPPPRGASSLTYQRFPQVSMWLLKDRIRFSEVTKRLLGKFTSDSGLRFFWSSWRSSGPWSAMVLFLVVLGGHRAPWSSMESCTLPNACRDQSGKCGLR